MMDNNVQRLPLKTWQEIIHAWAVRKEWRGPKAETQRTIGDDIALIHSEASEALESYRVNTDPLAYWETYTVQFGAEKIKNLTGTQVYLVTGETPDKLGLVGKPEGIGPELADTIIRILDLAEHVGLDMDFEVERKMAHNEQREIRHGGAHL